MTTDSNSDISEVKGQLFVQLIALIVISGTLAVFLYRQASAANKDLQTIQPQATQVINGFNQNREAIQNFVNEIVAYGEKHPEFRPVLAKYGIAPVPGIPAGSPAGATVPKK